MEIIKKHLTNGQYLTAEYEKTSIFLHHTAGPTAEGAWRWWNETPERVGTPFIIDRNGSVIECFDPKVWAFHLGIAGDDNYHEMHSVNIELVSCGRLYKDVDNKHKFYPLYPNKLYPQVIPDDDVYVFDETWRGHKLYHKYTDAQLNSLKDLITYIVGLFPSIKIPSTLGNFYEFNPEVVSKHLPGLWAHSTVRADKDDIFPYPPLLELLENLGATGFAAPQRSKPSKSTKNKAQI